MPYRKKTGIAIDRQWLDIGQLFTEGFKIYRANYRAILAAVVGIKFPLVILLALVPYENLFQSDNWRVLRIYNNISGFVTSFIGVIAMAAIALIVERAVQGEPITWKEAYRHGFSRWASSATTILLTAVILFGLTLLLIVPGIIWFVYYTFSLYVVALRNTSGKEALDYSKSLVKGRWWRIVGMTLLIQLPVSIITTAITFPVILWLDSEIISIVVALIGELLFSLSTVVEIVFFLNLDYRKHNTRIHKRRAENALPVSGAGM